MDAEVEVRRATEDDLEDLLGLAEQRRQQYRRYQSQFWRPAEDAVQQQRGFFRGLIDDAQAVVLLAELRSQFRGFVMARTLSAPPVYDPGGLTCLVDDFAVLDPVDWPRVGPALLDRARNWGAEKGAAQLVVVTAHLDEPKRTALQEAHLTLASEWWVGPIADGHPPAEPRGGGFRRQRPPECGSAGTTPLDRWGACPALAPSHQQLHTVVGVHIAEEPADLDGVVWPSAASAWSMKYSMGSTSRRPEPHRQCERRACQVPLRAPLSMHRAHAQPRSTPHQGSPA